MPDETLADMKGKTNTFILNKLAALITAIYMLFLCSIQQTHFFSLSHLIHPYPNEVNTIIISILQV